MAITATNPYVPSKDEEIILPAEHEQALHLMTTGQRILWWGILLAFAACLVWWWKPTLLWVNGVIMAFYVGVTLYKMTIIAASVRLGTQIVVTKDEIDALDEDILPRYTLLIPLFHEGEMFEREGKPSDFWRLRQYRTACAVPLHSQIQAVTEH